MKVLYKEGVALAGTFFTYFVIGRLAGEWWLRDSLTRMEQERREQEKGMEERNPQNTKKYPT